VDAALANSTRILIERRRALELGAQLLLQKETLVDGELKRALAATEA
jgi:ATP-dependent Zn protease